MREGSSFVELGWFRGVRGCGETGGAKRGCFVSWNARKPYHGGSHAKRDEAVRRPSRRAMCTLTAGTPREPRKPGVHEPVHRAERVEKDDESRPEAIRLAPGPVDAYRGRFGGRM